MRATTTPARHRAPHSGARLFVRPRRAAGVAAAALALSLMPGSALADDSPELVDVSLRVAGQEPVPAVAEARVWPGQVLEAHGVLVDADDIVAVMREGDRVFGKKRRLREGDVVRMTSVVKERKSKRQEVPAGVKEVFTTKLKPGKRKVVRLGEPGLRKVVAIRTLHNGEPVNYRVVKRKMLTEPRPRRVLVGRQPYSVPGADGLNWAALANCESGGNPNAVNPAGYYGLYQFNLATWRSVGGSGLPTSASAGEQTYRAKLLYKQRGRSPWPTCGRLL